MLFKSNKLNMMRSLSIRNIFLILLHFDMLLVSKGRHVMYNCKTSFCFAVLAFIGLFNPLSEHRSKLSMVAINTSEMRVLDLWHNTAASNDDSFYLNKLVNIIWSKISL